MYPNYLDQVLQFPEDAIVAYIMQYKTEVPELAAGDAEDYLKATLEALRRDGVLKVNTEPAGGDDNLDEQIVSSD